MLEIDAVIDKKPTRKLVREFAETRIRNLQAFRELQALNDEGRFQYKHPLIVQFSLRKQLLDLYNTSPVEFMREFSKVQDNVRRYKSLVNKKKQTDKERKQHQSNLTRYQEKEQLMEEIVNSKS